MPADSKGFGWTSAMVRLLGAVRLWRAPRRRAGLHDLMHMSDRMLADIGVRRADVHAAMSGLMPEQHLARTRGGSPWTAQIHRLHPQLHRRSKAADLNAA